MPLEAVAIDSFAAPIIKKPKHPDELLQRIQALYADHADFQQSPQAADFFETAFKKGDVLYVGMFNDKPICAMGCFDDGQTNAKRLQYLAVHEQNLNRGIEGKFIKQVYDAEVKKGVRQFVPADPVIHQIMTEYELLSVK